MGVPVDFTYVQHLIQREAVGPRVLDIGSFNRQSVEWGNARPLIESAGLQWCGADIEPGPDVDIVVDLLDAESVQAAGRWDTVLVMNVLEHVYDPIRALENAMTAVAPGGSCVVVVPVVWELHDVPGDYWRPLPDFFFEFARRNELDAPSGAMRWLVGDDMLTIDALGDGDQKLLPSAHTAAKVFGRRRARRSRIVHRAANTIGRRLFFPYVGLGVLLQKPS